MALGGGLAASVVTVVLVVTNPFGEKAVAPVPTTAAQKTTFEEIALPADAKILISDIKPGERKAFLPPLVMGGPTPQPAQDVQKESKRVIFNCKIWYVRQKGTWEPRIGFPRPHCSLPLGRLVIRQAGVFVGSQLQLDPVVLAGKILQY